MQQHSKLYSEIFPESLMMETFGTTTPTQSKKNEHFFNCWMAWRDNEFKTSALFVPAITPVQFKNLVKTSCKQMGLREFWDFQVRGFTVRFRDSEMKAFFKISVSNQWTT
jgi:hypothetical protein